MRKTVLSENKMIVDKLNAFEDLIPFEVASQRRYGAPGSACSPGVGTGVFDVPLRRAIWHKTP